ncbi:Rossmann-like and DUF2520 domain-containing protein [Coprobacter sp.]
MDIVFIGAGNLATRLSAIMIEQGYNIIQIYSKNLQNAKALGTSLSCAYTDDLSQIKDSADLYIFSVKDTVLQECIQSVKPNKALWVHTAGSIPMSVFESHIERYGVFYPLQTFSKDKKVNFSNIPFFIEANSEKDSQLLINIASRISQDVRVVSSEQRKYIHLAAVFACNFTNHMYAISAKLLEDHDLPFDVLLPLIQETADKVTKMSPVAAQTGPAVRYDENVMDKQLFLLEDNRLKEIYKLLSKSIHTFATNMSYEQNKL